MIGGLIVLLGIVTMVMVHEGGHFLAAKATGMKATEFFFGFGPKLWSIRRGETEYGVKAIPLGGYVRIVGMNPYEEVAEADLGRTYREQPFWAKSVVVLAGVASHFVVAFLIFFSVATLIGSEDVTTSVAAVQPTLEDGTATPAAAAGIRPGDTILRIGGVEVDSWDSIVQEIRANPGMTLIIRVERDSDEILLTATLAALDDDAGGKRGFLGVTPGTENNRMNPAAAFVDGGASVGRATYASVSGMWQLFSGLGDLIQATITGDSETIDRTRPASPIGLVRIGAQTEELGLGFTLELVALVNIFVGLFNVIPIYPLDGGHFSVALYEKVRGREADVAKLAPIAAAVVIFMVLLSVLAIYLDIANPFTL
jgi:membrane-associated protease RseP (regulator of RpoE activity)